MTVSKIKLSASTDGLGVKISQTATAGTLVHTAVTGTTDYDEIYLWAVNSDSSDRKVTVEFGGATSPDCLIEYTVPAEDGPHLIVPGLLLQNGLTVKVFAATANVVMIYGYALRIDN